MIALRHASFFSGVGGLDLGFENAGIRTVSLCEVDPYASAVLAERFPGVPNFGDITKIKEEDIPDAEIYSGGFPCQDLSTAGARRGFTEGTRSSLAFRFLDIVERRRPRWFVLENVPGLFSSNRGRDFGRLIREVDALGYGLAWRTLDARFFGVAQRRRRVFIVAARNDAFGGLGGERAAEVLLECEGVCGHLEASGTAGKETPAGAREGVGDAGEQHPSSHSGGVRGVDGVAEGLDDREGVDTFGAKVHRTLQARDWKVGVSNQDLNDLQRGDGFVVGASEEEARPQVEFVINETRPINKSDNGSGFSDKDIAQSFAHSAGAPAVFSIREDAKANNFSATEITIAGALSAVRAGEQSHHAQAFIALPPATVFRKAKRAKTSEDDETWVDDGIANTLTPFDATDIRTTHAVIQGENVDDDPLNPIGLDSNRYRCIGNGVVAPVAEFIGRRIVAVDAKYWKEAQ